MKKIIIIYLCLCSLIFSYNAKRKKEINVELLKKIKKAKTLEKKALELAKENFEFKCEMDKNKKIFKVKGNRITGYVDENGKPYGEWTFTTTLKDTNTNFSAKECYLDDKQIRWREGEILEYSSNEVYILKGYGWAEWIEVTLKVPNEVKYIFEYNNIGELKRVADNRRIFFKNFVPLYFWEEWENYKIVDETFN